MKDQISRQAWRLKLPRRLPLLALPLLALALGLLAPGHQSPAEAATGDLVGSVTFSVNCESGTGVGIAFDGANLWYSCFEGGSETSKLDLFRANPITGVVDASYNIVADGGLGALSYDATRNVIWAGVGGGGPGGEPVYKIPLDAAKNVSGPAVIAFTVPGDCPLDDGLAFDPRSLGDPSDDRLYYSNDCFTTTIRTFSLTGTLDESFPWGGSTGPSGSCYNSGLAVGGSLLYQGSDGCSHVWVVNKTSKAASFDFSTVVAADPNFRDEDLECDATTFAPKEVMWSKEAFNPMRAHAFEIPRGSCVTPGPDLTCTKELKPGVPRPQPGGTASYIIKCRNIGNQPTPAGIDVQLRDFLPAGSSLIFWTANGGICANNPPFVDCSRGRLAPGAEWWVEIKIKVPIRACSLINKVTIDPFDRIAETNENNNTASLTTVVQPCLYAGTDTEEFHPTTAPDRLAEMTLSPDGKKIISVVIKPTDVAVNGLAETSTGNLYSGDPFSNAHNVIDTNGGLVTAGTGPLAAGQCCHEDLALDPDGIHVWRSDYRFGAGNLFKYLKAGGAAVKVYPETEPVGATFIGTTLWISRWSPKQVGSWDPIGGFTLMFSTSSNAGGLAYDAAHKILWVGQAGGTIEAWQDMPGWTKISGSEFKPFGDMPDTVDGLALIAK